MSNISSDQISIVVQGAIAGKSDEPSEKRLTYRCLESLRKYLPEAEIILSTWENSDIRNLDYDILVESQDPGAWYLGDQKKALSEYLQKEYRPKILDNPNYTPRLNNVNRQIVSTKAGLLKASREYALKFRSDLLLEGNDFLKYFGKYKVRCEQWKILEERVLALTSCNPNKFFPFLFHPGDWLFFGKREDVLNIWNIPLMPHPKSQENLQDCSWFISYIDKPLISEIDEYIEPLDRYAPEQYIWISFLKKYGELKSDYHSDFSDQYLDISEQTIANNLILLEMRQFRIKFIKYPFPSLAELTLYTHLDWLNLYRKYCTHAKPILIDPEKISRITNCFFADDIEPKLSLNPKIIISRILVIWRFFSPRSYYRIRDFFRKLISQSSGSIFTPKNF